MKKWAERKCKKYSNKHYLVDKGDNELFLLHTLRRLPDLFLSSLTYAFGY